MKVFRYALLAEGNSDSSLIPMLTWLLERSGVSVPIVPAQVDKSLLLKQPKQSHLSYLGWRIQQCLKSYPCELLFVHRDSDTFNREDRVTEIQAAHKEAIQNAGQPFACAVPVQKLEAWLMADPKAICALCRNPDAQKKFAFLKLHELEGEAHAKQKLNELLFEVSELNKKKFARSGIIPELIIEYIDDFSPLLKLPAFAALDSELAALIEANGWNNPAP